MDEKKTNSTSAIRDLKVYRKAFLLSLFLAKRSSLFHRSFLNYLNVLNDPNDLNDPNQLTHLNFSQSPKSKIYLTR